MNIEQTTQQILLHFLNILPNYIMCCILSNISPFMSNSSEFFQVFCISDVINNTYVTMRINLHDDHITILMMKDFNSSYKKCFSHIERLTSKFYAYTVSQIVNHCAKKCLRESDGAFINGIWFYLKNSFFQTCLSNFERELSVGEVNFYLKNGY